MTTIDFDDDERSEAIDLHRPIRVVVNGRKEVRLVAPRTHLVDFVRDELGLTGSHTACEHGVCGACTVRLDGVVVRGCLVLAVQADGCRVETVEGLTESGAMRDLQDAFVTRNALQCGFCTPGMLMAAAELIETKPDATRAEVRDWISGNYCRCTGYHAIVDAICTTLASRRGAAESPKVPPVASTDDALHASSSEPRGQADLDAVGG
jgi:aerobic-type carbon monoxide dehydrogenase small subunit (CoxS/CutS family)